MQVKKRDGRVAKFNVALIEDAIKKASQAAGFTEYEAYNISKEIGDKVISKIAHTNKEVLAVEDIQNITENTLMCSSKKAIAKKYIEYRHERDIVRKEKDQYAKIGIDITSGEDTESQRENSNVPRGTITTQTEMIKRLYAKKFANDFLIPSRFKQAHNRGEIHIHDADALIVKNFNCCLMDYPSMLEQGFQLGNKWIEKPHTILTAMNVLVQMVQVQSNLQHGGLTLQSLDIHMADYVRGAFRRYFKMALEDVRGFDDDDIKVVEEKYSPVDPENESLVAPGNYGREVEIALKRTKQEVYKACKLLSYQLNTLQVRGESSPFVTIGYGLATDWAGRMIQHCILDERVDEFNRSGVQEFPKHLFAVKKGINFNKEDPNYDIFKKAIKTSTLTCYPDYIFPENQEKHTGGSAFYMG